MLTIRKRRSGFTLVELLLVFAILAVLIGLVVPAIMGGRRTGTAVSNNTDVAKLDAAVKDFQCKIKQYPPSRIKLCERRSDYAASNQLDIDSLIFIQSMFPGIDWNSPHPGAPAWVGIDWNGNGSPDGPVTLTGDQCLVFFLGGIPLPVSAGGPGCQGFSQTSDPSAAGNPRRDPFVRFQSRRLVDRVGNGFYSYRDEFGKQPYAYFSAYNTPNGYNRYGVSDCPGVGPGNGPGVVGGDDIYPYASSAGLFLRPDSFQIILAGPDCKFGFGSHPGITPTPFWTAASAPAMYSLPGNPDRNNYQDDQANFSATPLQNGP